MKKILLPYKNVTKEIWAFIALTLLSIIFFGSFVNLQPQVEDDFFFSSDDPQFQSELLISKLFTRNDTQLIISATGDIASIAYHEKIADLSNILISLNSVLDVKSLTHGPSDLEDALESPLWKRLIISDDRKSSNLIIFLNDSASKESIFDIEGVIDVFESPEFKLRVSGMPYIVELIRRSLLKDLQIFSVLAIIIFGFLIFQIFHSKGVLIGTLLACLNACMWTFMLTHLISIPVGLLTANLGTIIFVLTLSHIIFLTFNWRKSCSTSSKSSAVDEAIRMTFPASFWSMLTTLLGFLSLLSVQAKPLRELGGAGAIGTIVAIISAYCVFPAFLRIATPFHNTNSETSKKLSPIFVFFDRKKRSIALIIFISCLLALPGLSMIDSDPSLLNYFSKQSEIREGLNYIDRNGGSSPLLVVVRSQAQAHINTNQAYDELWKLQGALEQHRSVGSVISLPVLLAQAKDSFFSFFLPREWLLDIMSKPEHDAIAKSFVTEDRKYGLFLLRMTESNRTLPRLNIVKEIEDIVNVQGFVPELIGGIFILQGHLAKLVASSLILGLGKLIFLFGIISWLISRSLRVALSIMASISLVPLTILGLIGLYRIPLDIISAPASNVAIAVGIDAMIHMIKAYRRTGNWLEVRKQLWQPILTSMLVICSGFAIFLVSTFPPTQRFGLAILTGALLASFSALYVMPLLHHHIKLNQIHPNLKKLDNKLHTAIDFIWKKIITILSTNKK